MSQIYITNNSEINDSLDGIIQQIIFENNKVCPFCGAISSSQTYFKSRSDADKLSMFIKGPMGISITHNVRAQKCWIKRKNNNNLVIMQKNNFWSTAPEYEWNYMKFKCNTCKAEWVTDLYPKLNNSVLNNLSLEEIRNISLSLLSYLKNTYNIDIIKINTEYNNIFKKINEGITVIPKSFANNLSLNNSLFCDLTLQINIDSDRIKTTFDKYRFKVKKKTDSSIILLGSEPLSIGEALKEKVFSFKSARSSYITLFNLQYYVESNNTTTVRSIPGNFKAKIPTLDDILNLDENDRIITSYNNLYNQEEKNKDNKYKCTYWLNSYYRDSKGEENDIIYYIDENGCLKTHYNICQDNNKYCYAFSIVPYIKIDLFQDTLTDIKYINNVLYLDEELINKLPYQYKNILNSVKEPISTNAPDLSNFKITNKC